MPRLKGKSRSDVFHRSVTSRELETIEDVHGALTSWPSSLAETDQFLADAERQAFAVYARNGLPHGAWTFQKIGDGEWVPATRQEIDPSKSFKVCWVMKFAESFAADSDVGFATEVLENIRDLRNSLKSKKLKPEIVAHRAITLCRSLVFLTFEFGYSGALGRGFANVRATATGGAARATSLANKNSPRNAKWQRRADELFLSHPHHSKSAVAQIIARETGASMHTVRKIIAKT